jgi:hypothetical protein
LRPLGPEGIIACIAGGNLVGRGLQRQRATLTTEDIQGLKVDRSHIEICMPQKFICMGDLWMAQSLGLENQNDSYLKPAYKSP